MTYNVFGGTLSLTQSVNQHWYTHQLTATYPFSVSSQRCGIRTDLLLLSDQNLPYPFCTVQLSIVAAWLKGNGVAHYNEVSLRRARLVLGWVTVREFESRLHPLGI